MTAQDMIYATKPYIEALAPLLLVFTVVALSDELIYLMKKASTLFKSKSYWG